MVRLKAVVLVAMLVGTTFGVKALPMQVESSDEPVGLISLFSTGLIFQDRNDDQVIDFVNASLILGAQPSDSDIVAASDVAARLGFETMAMDIPVLGSPDEVTLGSLSARPPCLVLVFLLRMLALPTWSLARVLSKLFSQRTVNGL